MPRDAAAEGSRVSGSAPRNDPALDRRAKPGHRTPPQAATSATEQSKRHRSTTQPSNSTMTDKARRSKKRVAPRTANPDQAQAILRTAHPIRARPVQRYLGEVHNGGCISMKKGVRRRSWRPQTFLKWYNARP